MLEPWIIEQIRRREEEERRRRDERPRIDLPLSDDVWPPHSDQSDSDRKDKTERGVVIIGM
jgi:hypothetical protein